MTCDSFECHVILLTVMIFTHFLYKKNISENLNTSILSSKCLLHAQYLKHICLVDH